MELYFTKHTHRIVGLLSCLAVSVLGCSTFADYSVVSSVSVPVSSQGDGQKSLSEFGQRLGTRLAGVWQEFRTLVGGKGTGVQTSFLLPSVHPVPSSTSTGVLFFDDGVKSSFSDVIQHPQANFISVLEKEGIIVGQQGKFYPDNYLRLYDLIKMTVDIYRKQAGYLLSGDAGLLQEGFFRGTSSLPSRYLATASRLGFLSHISGDFVDMDDFQRFVRSEDMIQMMTNVAYQFSGMVSVSPLDHKDRITRGDAARYLVISFDLGSSHVSGELHTPFLDIYGHPFASQITTLAQLGVIASGTHYFYPDNYVHRYDFVIMLVNAFAVSKESSLPVAYGSGYSSPFADVSPQSSYAPAVFYAADNGWLAYLTVQKRNNQYFLPENLLSVHEIYTVLSRVTGKTFVYDQAKADTLSMTRAQLSALLCEVFGFVPVEQAVSSQEDVHQLSGLVDKLSALLQIKDLLAKL